MKETFVVYSSISRTKLILHGTYWCINQMVPYVLLSTRNHAKHDYLLKLSNQRAYYPEHTIKSIRINNADKLSSKAFNYYCMALGINVEYFHTYIKWLAKSLTKRMTYLIDHYHRIAVNIMLASYGLTHHNLNSNSYNCNQNGTPRCSKYVESWWKCISAPSVFWWIDWHHD